MPATVPPCPSNVDNRVSKIASKATATIPVCFTIQYRYVCVLYRYLCPDLDGCRALKMEHRPRKTHKGSQHPSTICFDVTEPLRYRLTRKAIPSDISAFINMDIFASQQHKTLGDRLLSSAFCEAHRGSGPDSVIIIDPPSHLVSGGSRNQELEGGKVNLKMGKPSPGPNMIVLLCTKGGETGRLPAIGRDLTSTCSSLTCLSLQI